MSDPFQYSEASLSFALFDQPRPALFETFVGANAQSGYRLELIGSRRAYAFAIAGSTDALALLLARGEWSSPQLDALIAEQAPVFQERMDRKLASRRYLSCETEGERRAVREELEDDAWCSMVRALPSEILSDRPDVPGWMAHIFAEAPNAFAVGRIAHLAKNGAHFSRIQPGDERQEIFDWLWAMGWVRQGFELNSLTLLRALTAEILKAQCRQFGLKDGGSKLQLAQRLIDRLGEEGVRATFAAHWPHVFELANGLVPEPAMLSSAWRWFTKYAEVFVEALRRKRYEIDSSTLRSVGFLKLNTARCARGCSRPKSKGAYDPKLHGVPPYDLLCECSVEVDHGRLYAAMAEEREKRLVEAASTSHQVITEESIRTDFTNLANDLTDAFQRIDFADRVACLIEPATASRRADNSQEDTDSKGFESGEPTGYRFCVTLSRIEGSSLRLEVEDARDESEASSGIASVLAEQGWKRPEDHEGDVGTICWEKIFDSELSTGNAAVTAAAQFAVDRLAETYAVALPTPSGRQRGPEKLDLLWLAIEVDLRISR